MTLNLNDTFKVTGGGHGKRVYKVAEITTDAFALKCIDQHGEVCFFSNQGLEIYESLKQLIIIERATEAEALANAKAALESEHVQSVEVGFEDEFNGIRIYTAVTYDTGIPHHYTVKVWNENDVPVAKCNCPADDVCRHILRVAIEDAKTFKRKVHTESFTKYKAHLSKKKSAHNCGGCPYCEARSGKGVSFANM